MNHPIHPDYINCKVVCSCGNTFVTRSTRSELRIDICGVCHPFYTGRQKFVDTAGRIQRFQEKFAWKDDAAKNAAAAKRQKPKKAAATTATSDDEE